MRDTKMTPLENETFEVKVAVNNLHRSIMLGIAYLAGTICGISIVFAVLSFIPVIENTFLQALIMLLSIGALTMGWLESNSISTGKPNQTIRLACVAMVIIAIISAIIGVV